MSGADPCIIAKNGEEEDVGGGTGTLLKCVHLYIRCRVPPKGDIISISRTGVDTGFQKGRVVRVTVNY